MKLTVTTTAVQLPTDNASTPFLQNIGPGTLYFDHSPTVTTGSGCKLAPGDSYEFPHDLGIGGGALYLIADATTEVRFLAVG